MGFTSEELDLAAQCVKELNNRGETVAFCESLTAGLASATLAGIPGASAVLAGGLVTYATEMKARLAGVPSDVLKAHGPVHPDTARWMAYGVRSRLSTTYGVALTGVAGPTTQDGHPVGEVFIAVASSQGTRVKECHFEGTRMEIRESSVVAALQLLLSVEREQKIRDDR